MIILPKNHQVFQTKQPLRILIGNATGGVDISGVWLLYQDGMVGRLTSIIAGGGVFAQLPNWKTTFVPPHNAAFIAPATSKLMLLSYDTDLFFNSSADAALTWSNQDSGFTNYPLMVDADKGTNHAWAIAYDDGSTFYAWHTIDGGGMWNSIALVGSLVDPSAKWLGAVRGADFAYCYIVQGAGPSTVTIFKILSDGTFTFEIFSAADLDDLPRGDLQDNSQNHGAIDPTDANRAYFISFLSQRLFTLDWAGVALGSQVLALNAGDFASIVFVTVIGTVLVFVDSTAVNNYIYRSTDNGVTWASITIADPNIYSFENQQVTELGGVVGTTPGTIIVSLNYDRGFSATFAGRFMFSTDDGLTWQLSGTVGYVSAQSASMRARS